MYVVYILTTPHCKWDSSETTPDQVLVWIPKGCQSSAYVWWWSLKDVRRYEVGTGNLAAYLCFLLHVVWFFCACQIWNLLVVTSHQLTSCRVVVASPPGEFPCLLSLTLAPSSSISLIVIRCGVMLLVLLGLVTFAFALLWQYNLSMKWYLHGLLFLCGRLFGVYSHGTMWMIFFECMFLCVCVSYCGSCSCM